MKHGGLARGGVRVTRATTPLYAFSRAHNRESLAGLCNSLKLLYTDDKSSPLCPGLGYTAQILGSAALGQILTTLP